MRGEIIAKAATFISWAWLAPAPELNTVQPALMPPASWQGSNWINSRGQINNRNRDRK